MTFKNGVTVSVQFGPGNYCDNYDLPMLVPPANSIESSDAEIAIWDKNKKWITTEFQDKDDTVLGHQSSEEVLKALNWAANYKREAKK